MLLCISNKSLLTILSNLPSKKKLKYTPKKLVAKPIETLKDHEKKKTSQTSLEKQPVRKGKTKNTKNGVSKKNLYPENNRYGERVPPPVPTNEPPIGMGDHVPAFLLRR